MNHRLYLSWIWFWAHVWNNAPVDWKMFNQLMLRYSEKHRKYHTIQHIYNAIRFCKRHFSEYFGIDLVILALFFHDAIYDIRSKTNEVDSANLWKEYAIGRFDQYAVNIINDLIVGTATHQVDGNSDELFKIMMDCDMSIFAAPSTEYLKYATNIWLEYREFGYDGYLKGRLYFLSTIDARNIFVSERLAGLNAIACSNIKKEESILYTNPSSILVSTIDFKI